MKKLAIGVLSVGLLIGGNLNVEAGTKVKLYSNCTAVKKDYKGGIAKAKGLTNWNTKNGKKVDAGFKYAPFVNATLYNENNKNNGRLDADKDGIMCETAK